MKNAPPPVGATPATLQDVLDRLAVNACLSPGRRRDLRCAVATYAKLTDRQPALIPLNLPDIRRTLDGMVPAQAKISAKRFANLRSDLGSAMDASGLMSILRTGEIEPNAAWTELLRRVPDQRRNGLSRLARWASLRGIRPEDVDDEVIERFITELEASTLIRRLPSLAGSVARTWNTVIRLYGPAGLRPVHAPTKRPASAQLIWQRLPASFVEDVARYLAWAAVPDPRAEGARKMALAPRTLALQKSLIRSAVTAAAAAGIPLDRITSLASLVEPETFRAILRQRWHDAGDKLTNHIHTMAVTLVGIAADWTGAPPEAVAALKSLRRKLGTLPAGLTPRNRALLRRFEDPNLRAAFVQLPDKLWRAARRGLTTSRRPFVDLQTALALDILIHVPLRIQNLAALRFDEHIHWPQGRHRPAVITFRADETKNDVVLEFEIPAALADRLYVYRTEIVPAVIGKRADCVFVSWTGKPRSPWAIRHCLERTVLRHLGVKLSPHQTRHLAAKFNLDANPGAYELVRQLLGHKNLKTTTSFYAGVDTRRAGRAHADLIMKLRESKFGLRGRRRTPRSRED